MNLRKKEDFDNVFVSVVMPVYNTKSSQLRKAIYSILRQTHKNFELIIIDDCSNNLDTIKLLDTFGRLPKVKLYRNPENRGISKSLNFGIDLSKGKYIFRMDSDDISRRKRLTHSIRVMEANPHIDIAGSNAITFGKKIIPIIMPESNESILFHSLFICPIVHPTVIFRADSIKEIHPIYKSLAAEDYELWVRLQMAGNIKFMNIQKTLLFYRMHKMQLSKISSVDTENVFQQYKNKLVDFYRLDVSPNDLLNSELDIKKIKETIGKIVSDEEKKLQILKDFTYFFVKNRIKTFSFKNILEMITLFKLVYLEKNI